MTFTQITYIVALAKHGSFVRAAEHCFVSQPTLSMQIQKLEDHLGVQIFDRSTPVKPTPHGEVILAEARLIIAQKDNLLHRVEELKGIFTGRMNLAIIPTAAASLLPLILPKLKAHYPEISFHVSEVPTDQVIAGLKDGSYDFGILATPLHESSLTEYHLYNEPFVAYVHPQHRLAKRDFVTVKDLPIEELIVLDQGHCFRNSMLTLCNLDSNSPFSMQVGNFNTIVNLVKKGLGITLLPFLHAKTLGSSKQMVKHFIAPVPTREISMLVPSTLTHRVIWDKIRATITESLPKHLRENGDGQTIHPF